MAAQQPQIKILKREAHAAKEEEQQSRGQKVRGSQLKEEKSKSEKTS